MLTCNSEENSAEKSTSFEQVPHSWCSSARPISLPPQVRGSVATGQRGKELPGHMGGAFREKKQDLAAGQNQWYHFPFKAHQEMAMGFSKAKSVGPR